ncbi:MAG: DUF4332 domain-containing protein [Lewinellaceae bacterium]|nr:DUF4332 domain-containing protein [Saprospiraceae bacterium]MCB9342346.1 DUF4332 domain-containing protein [Lewinellaceae bacterium]
MTLTYILLDNCTFMGNLPIALALCLIPFLLGWLAAAAYYRVGALKARIAELTAENGGLHTKIGDQALEITDLRVKITQLESDLESKNEQIRKLKNDLIICENDLSKLKDKSGPAKSAAKTGAKAAGAAAAASIMFAGKKVKADDLKIVEGIGPKIADLLIKAGIKTWQALSETKPAKIKEILDAAGPSFQMHDPGSWPKQAGMAAKGQWDALKKLQDELDGGK